MKWPVVLVLGVCAAFASSRGHADEQPAVEAPSAPPAADRPSLVDPDSEVARRNYERGLELYDHGDYATAIAVFQAANEARPSAALEFDIARCYDRMGDWARALDGYHRYWRAAKPAQRDETTRARISELEERLYRSQLPRELERRRRLRIAAYALGAAAIASVAVGGGLYGWAKADLPAREAYCRSLPRECVPAEWSDLGARANASYALFAIGAAAAAGDAALWVLSARDRRTRHAWVSPTQSGLSLGASF